MQIDDPAALEHLIERLEQLRPDAERQWGTMTAGEMLCHLADGNDWLRGTLAIEAPANGPTRRLLKWIALYAPIKPGRNFPTHPSVDPKADGTKPGDFESDRERTIEGLRAVAALAPEQLPPRHPVFGPMSIRDWYRSAYRHYDHHLRQFAV